MPTEDEMLADMQRALELLAQGLLDPDDPRRDDAQWRASVEEFLKHRWPRFQRRNAG